jgi:hypothetical protein
MVEIAEAAPRAERSACAGEAVERRRFGFFVTVLIVAQALWLSGLSFGIYALVT